MRRLLSILCLIAPVAAFAQALEIWKVEQEGQHINIYYDLGDKSSNQKYTVYLYASIDGFTKPLTHVTGDIGDNIPGGMSKKAVWNMAREFGETFGATHSESISFEVRAEPFEPFATLQQSYTQLKRGKTYPLTWTTNRGEGVVFVDLLRNGELVSREAATSSNNHDLFLSKKLKLGKYKIRLVNRDDESLSTTSDELVIRPKTPFIVKAIPVVAAGVLIFVLTKPKSPSRGARLPDPALPPD